MDDSNLDLTLERYANELKKHAEFIAEGLALEVIEAMLKILRERGLSRSWLAKQMGVSRSSVSRMMNAPPNMTLLTISRIALALGTTPAVLLDAKSGRAGAAEREAACVADTSGSEYEGQPAKARASRSPQRRGGRAKGSR